MTRKAFVGLSSPTAYFYDPYKKYFAQEWEWNPILESPQGIITLFDEIWFLSRALCPVSMRNEKYVKFLDEDSDYLPLIKGVASTFHKGGLDALVAENEFIDKIVRLGYSYASEQFKRYNKIIEHVYGQQPSEKAPIDNHSHRINIGNHAFSGNSMRLDLIAFDVAILGRLGVRNIEFITNRFNNSALKVDISALNDIQVSQGVTIKRIPVLQTPAGPIIDRIESIRESNFLVDFRSKILTESKPENLADIVNAVENQFQTYRNNVLLEKQRGSQLITSWSNNLLSLLLGSIVPGAGEVKSLIQDNKARSFSWTGFLAELENSNQEGKSK